MSVSATDAPLLEAPLLEARRLAVGYGGRRRTVVLGGIDAALRRGECAALLGPNGSGKSTLLRTLAGLQRPLDGAVLLGGRDLARLSPGEIARQLSVVLTEPIDAAQLTAWDVVALGRAPHAGFSGRLSEADRAAVRAALSETSAAALAPRPLHDLSDGERQRVMIARALAQQPSVILLDEPTAFLDLEARADVARLLRRLAREDAGQRRGILLTTHDFDLAMQIADRLWLIRRDGSLAVGAPDELAEQGELAALFHHSAVRFDAGTHRFELDLAEDVAPEAQTRYAGDALPGSSIGRAGGC